MEKVMAFFSGAGSTLFIAQALLISIRHAIRRHQGRGVLLAGSLALLGLLPLLVDFDWLHEIAFVGALGMAGAFFSRSSVRKRVLEWLGSSLGFVLVLFFGEAMGYRGSLPFQVLRAFGAAGLCIALLILLIWMARSARSRVLFSTIACAAAWMLAGAVTLIAHLAEAPLAVDLQALPLFLLSLCTGWLVFQEGYPEHAGWNGALRGVSTTEEAAAVLRTRLMALENSLARQDRLIAAGTLAAGAAHEFKNVLSAIRASAEHGLGQISIDAKDRALALVVEHTRSARDSAVDSLEKLASEGREKSRLMAAARDLEACLRGERASLRASGIIIEAAFATDVMFHACPGDVEQVLHNLIQNAAQAYGDIFKGAPRDKVIRVAARYVGDYAVIEVKDTAGGISEERRRGLFSMGTSGSGSTGLGLYLSRNLAHANGGNVEYEPTDEGSIFRIILPREEEDNLG
jgi:signal transduction histidine kinase